MCDRRRPLKEQLGWTAALWALLMVRACAAGATYWPQLDDYIQMHNYLKLFDFPTLQKVVGVLAMRPLAGLADYFVWGRMFGFMLLGVAIISLLYAAAAVLLWSVLGRFFRVGPLFPIIMVLLPLGMEGTYWMSASTRVVVGLFWAALAAWMFFKWLDTSKPWALTSFLTCQLLPFGFYEQSGVFAVTLTVGLAILCRIKEKKHGKKCLLAVLWAPAAMVLYLLLTKLLSGGGVYGSRSALMLPTTPYYFNTFLPDILGQIKTVFLNANLRILSRGFLRAARELLAGRLILWFLLTAALCALLWRLGQEGESRGECFPLWAQLISGLLLAAAPVTLFLILDNPWFSLRGAVTSFPGIALVCDTVFLLLRQRVPKGRTVGAVCTGIAALVLCMAGASEIGDYRQTFLNDQKAADAIFAQLPKDYPTEGSARGMSVGLLGMEPSRLDNVNFKWHEHVQGCTESSWALAGLLTSREQEVHLPAITPLPTDPIYKVWNRESNRVDGFDALYYYDGEGLEQIYLEETGEMRYEVYTADGQWMGRIWEEDQVGYFRTPEQLAAQKNG